MAKHLFTISLILSICNLNAQQSKTASAENFSVYESYIKEEIEGGEVAGVVSLVWKDGEIVHNEAFGYQGLADKIPMQSDHIFYIQSMTKPIISIAFMMLYEEGHFQLDDPVSKYLPQFDSLKVATDVAQGLDQETVAPKSQITIKQILSHTAGFSHGLGGTELDNGILRALYFMPKANIETRVNTLCNVPLIGQPGEQWYYSASPDVLALLIEKFSGTTVNTFLQERIFDPLSMDDTGYNLPEEKHDRVAYLHSKNEDGVLIQNVMQTPKTGHVVFGGTHGLFSTAADYLAFCKMLINGGTIDGKTFIKKETLDLMTQDHVGEIYPDAGEGFGLGFGILTDPTKVSFAGSKGQYYWSGAYNTHFFIDPAENLISLLMTQGAPYSNKYRHKMRQYVYDAVGE